MRVKKVHLRLKTGKYKCGVGKRWMSQDVSSVTNKKSRKLSCKSCKKTKKPCKTSVRSLREQVKLSVKNDILKSIFGL